MSLILSGTNGLSDVDGSAATPSIRGTDTDTGIFFPTADTIAFTEGGAEVLRIDSSGRLLVGNTSQVATSVAKLQVVGSGVSAGLTLAKSDSPSSGGSISGIDSYGFDSSVYFVGGTINFRAAENWSATNHGTDIQFRTTPSGSMGGLFEAMRIASTGNVGIGTSSPSAPLSRRALVVRGTTNGGEVIIQSTTATDGTSDGFALIAGGSDAYVYNRLSGGFMVFGTSNTERMRITSAGDLLVGTSSFTTGGIQKTIVSSGTASAGFQIQLSGNVGSYIYGYTSGVCGYRVETTSSYPNIQMVSGGTGGVSLSSGATAWASMSDERLKTNLLPITGAVEKVCSLRTVTGRYESDDVSVSRAFLIAQDVQAVLPEAVTTIKQKDDDAEYLGLQYTDTIPLFVAAIKEQQTMIEQLKADVAALNGTV
jgi:hypothetical protein